MSLRCQARRVSGVTIVAISRSRCRPGILALAAKRRALIVVQVEAFGSQLLAQHLVFFAEIIDGVALLLAQPSRNRNQQ